MAKHCDALVEPRKADLVGRRDKKNGGRQ